MKPSSAPSLFHRIHTCRRFLARCGIPVCTEPSSPLSLPSGSGPLPGASRRPARESNTRARVTGSFRLFGCEGLLATTTTVSTLPFLALLSSYHHHHHHNSAPCSPWDLSRAWLPSAPSRVGRSGGTHALRSRSARVLRERGSAPRSCFLSREAVAASLNRWAVRSSRRRRLRRPLFTPLTELAPLPTIPCVAVSTSAHPPGSVGSHCASASPLPLFFSLFLRTAQSAPSSRPDQ